MTPTSPKVIRGNWQDPYGNSAEELIDLAVTGIVNSQEAWRYDPDQFPAWAVRKALERVTQARGKHRRVLEPVSVPGLAMILERQLA